MSVLRALIVCPFFMHCPSICSVTSGLVSMMGQSPTTHADLEVFQKLCIPGLETTFMPSHLFIACLREFLASSISLGLQSTCLCLLECVFFKREVFSFITIFASQTYIGVTYYSCKSQAVLVFFFSPYLTVYINGTSLQGSVI